MLHRVRQSASDLEISGRVRGLSAGERGYVRYAELAKLPRVDAEIDDPDLGSARLRVSGVYLDTLTKAIGVLPSSDMTDALCSDQYRSPLPQEYVAAHRPILLLTINGMLPAEWAAKSRQDDPGPYLIVYQNFVPGFRVLAHEDRPQLPTNVVRLNFGTEAETFGAIAPRGQFAEGSPEMEGFAIAKQNCLRCHAMGRFGGTKSGKSWVTLGNIAARRPAFFAAYVRDPKADDAETKMPGNPEYDAATLHALTAYFRTFAVTGQR
jgi:cytochrome c1